MAARRYAQIEITQEEYDAVFASDDVSDSNLSFSDVNVDADISDIEVQEFSEEESGESASEDSESESDESTASDEPEWSRDLHAFVIEPFSGSHGLKVPVPVETKAVDFFGLLFGEPVFDLIVCETKVGSISSKARKVDRRKQTRNNEMATAQRGQLVFTKWHNKRDVAFPSTNVSPDEPSRLIPRIHNRQNVNIEKLRVSDVYTTRMGGVVVLTSFVLFIALGGSQKSGINTYFGFLLMYLFVMLLFLNQNMLDRSVNQYISNLTLHNN